MTAPNHIRKIKCHIDTKEGFESYTKNETNYENDALCFCPYCNMDMYGSVAPLRKQEDIDNAVLSLGAHSYSDGRYYGMVLGHTYSGESNIIIHSCRQCGHETIIISHQKNDKKDLTVIHSTQFQSMNELVPKNVSFYMLEAEKCISSNAYCAAIVMYRTVLELILINKQVEGNSLNEQIKNLSSEKYSWLRDFDEDYMNVIRQLGNEIVHSEDNSEPEIDRETSMIIKDVLTKMIDQIYIKPVEKKTDLDSLKSKVKNKPFFNKNKGRS